MVRERCKFFRCSQVEGTSTPSSVVAVNNVQPQHQCRRAPFSPQPLQPLSFLRLFDKGCSDLYELIPPCTFLSYISVHFTMLKAFHVIFLKTMWVKLIFWDGPCGHWPCSESSPSPPRASAEDGCVFLQPSVLEPVKCQSAVFPLLLPKAATWGQHITLRCFVLLAKLIFIFSLGVELISVVVLVSGLQELDSII